MDRDYNQECKDHAQHKYAYSFDLDVMHPYMIRAFTPYFRPGNALELGCYQGAFTQHIAKIFQEITCIEASTEAVQKAKERMKKEPHVRFLTSVFEQAKLNQTYENIFLTHVLEHCSDRIGVLQKIRREWLSQTGRLYVACPNANAPSRQIAVNMGLIPFPAAVTDAERMHGHTITYNLDTLEAEIREAGLTVVHKSGIFFKALANFQWDRLLDTDIISKEYLDGCYALGEKYPDLCSSIYCVCMK